MSHINNFWRQVRSGKPNACWLWLGARTPEGYGVIWWNGKIIGVHRLAWELNHGLKLGRWQVRHKCDNPPCCNPLHLLRGTQKQNVHDAYKRGRMPNLKGVAKPCIQGERNVHSKLTAQDVRWARRNVLSGQMRLLDASKILGVSKGNLCSIVHRKAWKHIK